MRSRNRQPAKRMPDEHEAFQPGPVRGADDGLHTIVERYRGEIGWAAAPAGQIDGDRRHQQMRE